MEQAALLVGGHVASFAVPKLVRVSYDVEATYWSKYISLTIIFTHTVVEHCYIGDNIVGRRIVRADKPGNLVFGDRDTI